MTDASGAELEYSDYAPFGSQRAHTGTNTSDYKYTDQELDAENGLYNYNARLYDPFIGRFISADTVVQAPYNPQSLNRYSYCLNNPLIYVDPSGHVSEEDLLKAGYTYDKETGDWLMPGIEVTAPRVYMCTNGFGGLAYLTSEQIMGSWGVWHVIEPVPSVLEINNEYQQRLERYLSSTAPQGGNSRGGRRTSVYPSTICDAVLPASPVKEVALTCFAEATCNCYEGDQEKRAITDSIYNRVSADRSYWGGNTVLGVLSQSKQFLGYDNSRYHMGEKTQSLNVNECEQLKQCIAAAQASASGTINTYNGFNQTQKEGRTHICVHYFRTEE